MFISDSDKHEVKDILLVGAVINANRTTQLIGVSTVRCIKCILNQDLLEHNTINADKYNDIPLYGPNKNLRTNYLFYIAKYAEMHIFSNGLGELIAFSLKEVESLKKNEKFTFKNCRISKTTEKKRGSISAVDGTICDWESIGSAYSSNEYTKKWNRSTPIDGIQADSGSIVHAIIHTRLLEAFINRYNYLESTGILNANTANKYRVNIRQTIKIGKAILNLYCKYGMRVALMGDINSTRRLDEYAIRSPLLEMLYCSGRIVSIGMDSENQRFISISPTTKEVVISGLGFYAQKLEYESLDIDIIEESIRFTGYSRQADQYSIGARYQIIINPNNKIEYRVEPWDSSMYKNGSRKSLEALTEFTNGNSIDIYKREKFKFNCFVERDAEVRYKQYKFKCNNEYNFELKNYTGITAEDFIVLLNRSERKPDEIKASKPTNDKLYKIELLNRYEFVKYYDVGNKKDTQILAYIEIFSNGKIIKTAYIVDYSFDEYKTYDEIEYIPKWQRELAELNYKEYAGKRRITIDNRIYSEAYLRNIYKNRDNYYTYGQICGLAGYTFGICIRQDILTGIYYLCYRVALNEDEIIGQLVTYSKEDKTNAIKEPEENIGYIKICAFKDREYAINLFFKIRKLLAYYSMSCREDHDKCVGLFKDFIRNNFTVRESSIRELNEQELLVNRTYILTRLFYCTLKKSGTEKLLTSIFGNNLGIIGD